MIGTLGMSISAFCQWVFIYQRYRFIELKVPNIWRVNYFNYLLGCVSAFGCLGVGPFCLGDHCIRWVQHISTYKHVVDRPSNRESR